MAAMATWKVPMKDIPVMCVCCSTCRRWVRITFWCLLPQTVCVSAWTCNGMPPMLLLSPGLTSGFIWALLTVTSCCANVPKGSYRIEDFGKKWRTNTLVTEPKHVLYAHTAIPCFVICLVPCPMWMNIQVWRKFRFSIPVSRYLNMRKVNCWLLRMNWKLREKTNTGGLTV